MTRRLRQRLRDGMVIPAHPLAIDDRRRLCERYQRGLSRYYIASGSGGLAVGVHTTQFAIHEPSVGLLEPVLSLAADECRRHRESTGETESLLLIAGLVGDTRQAVREAELAVGLGYDVGLLGLRGFEAASIDDLIHHVRTVAATIPVMGFYLQPAVGGRVLPYEFWRRFAEIENVVAIKIAPFNRYQTLDVVRAVADAGRIEEIALYTGNDDTIVADLMTPFPFGSARISGGLLGHWACWTSKAVELLESIRGTNDRGDVGVWLERAAEVTDCNAAFFDAANGFAGCIAGIHEVLRRQGLMPNRLTLDPDEALSPGQAAEIDRVWNSYPHLNDDAFVEANRDAWLAG